MMNEMKLPNSASGPLENEETLFIPIIQIENPFYGKPYLTAYEVLEAINILSKSMKEIERNR